VAYAPNDSSSAMLMEAVENYYGLQTQGFVDEVTMAKFLKDHNDNSSTAGKAATLELLVT